MRTEAIANLASEARGRTMEWPVDVEMVLAGLGVRIDERALPPTLDGVTVSDFQVVVRKGLGKKRRRFVLAHELGHVFVKRGQAPWVSARSEEQFADEFALALLIPSTEGTTEARKLAKRAVVETRVATWAVLRSGQLRTVVVLSDGTVVCSECGFRQRAGGCTCNRLRAGVAAAC